MYPNLAELERLARLTDSRPVVMCDYSHAMGNSNGGIADYWDVIGRLDQAHGGFIWDWVDQGLARYSEDGQRWWAYGGDFGDNPNDRNFNCNGLVDADRLAHTDLSDLDLGWEPVVDGLVTDSGEYEAPRVAPVETVEIDLGLSVPGLGPGSEAYVRIL